MGYTTDFLGHIEIRPALNLEEQRYLTAFMHTRHYRREDGQYDVPGNPVAEDRDLVDIDRYNEVEPRQPSFHCQWEPCWEGCCIAWSGMEKFYDAVPWLEYLIDHFLRSDGYAAASGLPVFESFTFDHRADGVVAACRRDTRDLLLIRVTNNQVSEEVLWSPDASYLGLPPLPYEKEIDRWEERRSRRRRRA